MALSADVAGFQFCFANVVYFICLRSFVSAVLIMSQLQVVFSVAKRTEQKVSSCEWRFSHRHSVPEVNNEKVFPV